MGDVGQQLTIQGIKVVRRGQCFQGDASLSHEARIDEIVISPELEGK